MIHVIKPIKGRYFIKWLHSGLYQIASKMESESSKCFYNHKNISKKMKDFRYGGYVIFDLNRPVGYVMFKQNNSKIHLKNIVIVSDYRREGIATILINRLKSFNKKIIVNTKDSNLKAHLFFSKCGFKASLKRGCFENKEDIYQFIFKPQI
jgi:ribosomal protein S18 acetylase RimI-like enzyme